MRLAFCDHHICAILASLSEAPLDMALSNYFRAHKSLGAQDRRTIGETIYGMFRYKSLLDHLCPDGSPLARLLCFKEMQAAPNEILAPEYAQLGTSVYLLQKFTAAYGKEKATALCRILNEQAPVFIRANLLKTTQEELLQKLSTRFPLGKCKKAPAGLQLVKREPLFALAEFKEGLFEVQDEGSQLVAHLVKAKPGDHVLDYCSGSGGKTLAIAPAMQGKGQIYLHDNRPQALQQAKQRLRRAGVQNVQFVLPKHPVDWILADVPCSGTGTLRRNPDAKWKIDEEMVQRLVKEQHAIVKESLRFLKPSGRFVYATCSILPEENENQVKYFIDTHGLELVETLTLLPESGGADGFFAAVFKKAAVV
jgi:16S rRNA (cytosine967-C5)-methyltransferase